MAISLSSNPTILRYLVGHKCLSAITCGTLNNVESAPQIVREGPLLTGSRLVADLNSCNKTCQLYIPTNFNFLDIDAAVIQLDYKEQLAYVYPIQNDGC